MSNTNRAFEYLNSLNEDELDKLLKEVINSLGDLPQEINDNIFLSCSVQDIVNSHSTQEKKNA